MTTEYEILFAEEFFRQQAAEEKNKVFDDALVRDYEMTFSTPHGQRDRKFKRNVFRGPKRYGALHPVVFPDAQVQGAQRWLSLPVIQT
jgi:hypothetical protein